MQKNATHDSESGEFSVENSLLDDPALLEQVGEQSDGDEDSSDEAAEPAATVVAPIDELKSVLAAELSTDTTQFYLNQIGTRPLFDAAEELHFATLAKQGNFQARQKMIEHNLRLVVS